MLFLLLWHRGCLSDITGALFCSPCTLCGRFPVSLPFAFVCCFKRLFACFCHEMTFYQPGTYDHCVLYTTAQLTEGRSARDQPKQPPAKKKAWPLAFATPVADLCWGGTYWCPSSWLGRFCSLQATGSRRHHQAFRCCH